MGPRRANEDTFKLPYGHNLHFGAKNVYGLLLCFLFCFVFVFIILCYINLCERYKSSAQLHTWSGMVEQCPWYAVGEAGEPLITFHWAFRHYRKSGQNGICVRKC